MGNKLQNSADAMQRVARDYQAVIDMAAELSRIGNVEEAGETASRRLAQARVDLDAVTKKLQQAEYDLDIAKDDAKELIKSATEEARKIIQGAQDDAAKKHSEAVYLANEETKAAREQAAAIVAAARMDVEAMRAAHEEEMKRRAGDLAAIELDIKNAEERLNKKQAELEVVEARLASIHEGVSTLTKTS